MIRWRTVVCFGVVCLLLASTAQAAFVWVEGESASAKSVHHNVWWEAVREGGLSGGAMVGSFSEPDQDTGTATIPFSVPQSDTYELWVRVSSGGTGYDYQLDDRPRKHLDPGAVRREDQENRRTEGYRPRFHDERNLALDGTTDARYYAWILLGDVQLEQGEHTLKFWLGSTEAEKRFGAVDAFVLTTEGFEPNGQFKPGEVNPRELTYDPADMWSFAPERDPLSDDALLDLRFLNEDAAGEHGFIRLSDDGFSFVRGDGEPIRFWGGTDYVQREAFQMIRYHERQIERYRNEGRSEAVEEEIKRLEEARRQAWEDLRHHARFLAKRGVNIVRWHGHLPASLSRSEAEAGRELKLSDIDEEALDQAFRLVAAMKEAGIYSILSPYWGSHTKIQPGWDLPDPENDNLSALVFFVPEVKAAYKAWLKDLYTRPNPYTGVPLKDDPAVAIIQLQNEDSMLFWTMQRVHGEAEMILRQRFADWLREKYGSLDGARKAWENYEYTFPASPDNWEAGLPGLFIVWEFTRDAMAEKGGQPGFRQRRADQLQFFTEVMYDFNREIAQYLREELGCKQLINAGNWKTCDPVLVEDAERYSYTANEVIGKNHYFSGLHTGRTRGWQILPDHIFTNLSAARQPRDLPTCIKQVWEHPFIIPESLWVPPNRYESEGPVIVASQQCLNGVDTFFWFANGAVEWVPAVRGQNVTKWTYATPMQLGQFPAAALMYRRGYVRQGEPVVIERRRLDDIWQGRLPLLAETPAYDPNRDEGDFAADLNLDSPIDPLVFLVGPVFAEYDADPADTMVSDYQEYIDRQRQIVRSNTDQIAIDYGRGVYTVDAPQAQAAVGFLGSVGAVELADVDIRCGNDHASLAVVSLDGKPLARSEKLLVQAGTFQRPAGWKVERIELVIDEEPTDAYRIMDTGEEPWQIRKIEATVSVANDAVTRAVQLDANGMPQQEVQCTRRDGRITVDLPPDTLYLLLTR